MRFIALVFIALLLGLSLQLTMQNADLAGLVAYGKRATAKDSSVEKIATGRLDALGDSCRSEPMLTGQKLYLLKLARADAIRDYDSWYDTAMGAEQFMRRAIRCAPMNGGSWLAAAISSQAATEQPDRVIGLVRMARLLNPIERPQLDARLALWNRVSSTTADLGKDLLAQDIDLALRLGDYDDVRAVLSLRHRVADELIRNSVARLPAERRKVVQSWEPR